MKATNNIKSVSLEQLAYYMGLPWTYRVEVIYEDGEKLYLVHVNELPGVCTHGSTLEQAMKEIEYPLEGALELYLEMGDPIPVPAGTHESEDAIS